MQIRHSTTKINVVRDISAGQCFVVRGEIYIRVEDDESKLDKRYSWGVDLKTGSLGRFEKTTPANIPTSAVVSVKGVG